jgi:hypothetical protein
MAAFGGCALLLSAVLAQGVSAATSDPLDSGFLPLRDRSDYVLNLQGGNEPLDPSLEYRVFVRGLEVPTDQSLVKVSEHQLDVHLHPEVLNRHVHDTEPVHLKFQVKGYAPAPKRGAKPRFETEPITLTLPPRFPVEVNLVEIFWAQEEGWVNGPTKPLRQRSGWSEKRGEKTLWFERQFPEVLSVTVPEGADMTRNSVSLVLPKEAEDYKGRDGTRYVSIRKIGNPYFSPDGRTAYWRVENCGRQLYNVGLKVLQFPISRETARVFPGPLAGRLPIGLSTVQLSPSFRMFRLELKFPGGRTEVLTPQRLEAPGARARLKPTAAGPLLELELSWPSRGGPKRPVLHPLDFERLCLSSGEIRGLTGSPGRLSESPPR